MRFGSNYLLRQLHMDGGASSGAATATPEGTATEPEHTDLSFASLGIDMTDLGLPANTPDAGQQAAPSTPSHNTGAPGLQPPADPQHQLPGQQPAGQQQPGQQPPAGEEIAYRNHADLVLRHLAGVQEEQITIDGQSYAIGELPEELQARVITETFEDYQTAIGERDQLIAQLQQQGGQQAQPQNEVESAVLAALRAGNTRELLQTIEQHDPVTRLERMSATDRVRAELINQGYTEASAAAELEDMRPGQVERRAQAILEAARSQQQANFEYLRSLQQPEAGTGDDYEAEVAQVVTYAQSLREMRAGEHVLPLNPEHVNYLLAQTTALNPQTQTTPFMERASTPQGVLEYEFWRTYGPMLYQSQQQQIAQAYQAGQNAVRGGYPTQPHMAAPTPAGKDQPLDFDALSRPSQIGS